MKRIILFGDSLMAGYKNNYATSVVTKAVQKEFPDIAIINKSVPGATSREGIDFLPRRVQKPYELVVLGLGTNDASIQLGISAGAYAKNLQYFTNVIGRNKLILVGPSYTDWKRASDHSWPRTLQFELVAQECARHNSLPFLDLAKVLRDTGHPNDFLQDDGIHFNEQGNELFTGHINELIKKKLNR